MCSNRAFVENLECCLEDLIECFEDFVKKSLILIFLGIGIIVGLLCYLLKIVSQRPPLNNALTALENTTLTRNKVNDLISNRKVKQEVNENKTNMLRENECRQNDNIDNKILTLDKNKEEDKTRTGNYTPHEPIVPSFDENILRGGSLSPCSKYGCGVGSSSHINIPSRVPVPSLPTSPTSSSKHKLIPCLRKRSLVKGVVPSLQIYPKTLKPGSCCSMCCKDEQKMNEDTDKQTSHRNKQ